jgi:hypothetical protein
VRRVKAALIDRVAAFGRFDVPKRFASPKDEAAWILQHFCGATLWKGRPKFAVDPLPAMPAQEPQRTAEAVRRELPAQAAALRSPRRHAQRPHHPLDRKESIYSRNTLRLCPVHFCKTNPICCRIFRCLSVEG